MGDERVQTEQYNEKIRSLLRQLDALEQKGYRFCRDAAQHLLEEGTALDDAALLGVAWFYKGAYHYAVSELSDATDCFTKALAYLQPACEWRFAARCYNMLGLLTDYQDDVIGSINCFYSGIALAREHHDHFNTAVMCLNLSLIFEEGDDMDSALEYRLRALRELECAKDNARYGELRLLSESMLLRIYLSQNKEEETHRQMALVNQLLDAFPERQDSLDVLVYQTEYARRYGKPEEAQELMNRALQAFADCDSYVDACDDCLALAKCLAESGEFEQCMEVLDRTAQGLTGGAQTDVRLQCQLQICCIECCEMWGEPGRERQIAALKAYFELSRRRGRYYRQVRRRMLDLRHVLENARSENERLTHNAETDPLTGLANRRKLQEMQDQWFERAQREGRRLGVAMLDIDHFKELNDNFGHAAGDDGLCFVASVLRENSGDRVFVSRYGGDEFMILCFDMSDEEIDGIMRGIRARIERGSASLRCGNFAVSVGVRNSVPRPDNHIWDYTAAADAALYKIKRCGRNDYLLVHSTKDVPAKSWMNAASTRHKTVCEHIRKSNGKRKTSSQ